MITNVPWYVTNQTLLDDLKVPFIKVVKVVIQEKSMNYHDKIEYHFIRECNHYWNSNKEEG
jgi:hypothetical protein